MADGHDADIIWPGINGSIAIAPMGGTETTYSGQITDFKISGGARDTESVSAFSDVTYIFDKPMEQIEVSLTVIKQDTDIARSFLGGTDVANPILLSGAGTRASYWHIVASWNNTNYSTSGSYRHFRVDCRNVRAVSKELSCAADGYMEETISFKLKPADYREEFTSDVSGSPIPSMTW